jgi:hypothetical protein
MHVQRRQAGMIKTDKRDALSLANQLYTQLECAIRSPQTEQSGDGRQRAIFDNYLSDVGRNDQPLRWASDSHTPITATGPQGDEAGYKVTKP